MVSFPSAEGTRAFAETLLNTRLRLQQMSHRSPPNIHAAWLEACTAMVIQSTVRASRKYSYFLCPIALHFFSSLSSLLLSRSVLIPFSFPSVLICISLTAPVLFSSWFVTLLSLLGPARCFFLCALICFDNGKCVRWLLLWTKLVISEESVSCSRCWWTWCKRLTLKSWTLLKLVFLTKFLMMCVWRGHSDFSDLVVK